MSKIIILFFLAFIELFVNLFIEKMGEKVQEEKQVDDSIAYLILLLVSFFFGCYVVMFGFNQYLAPILGVNALSYWQVVVVKAVLNLITY